MSEIILNKTTKDLAMLSKDDIVKAVEKINVEDNPIECALLANTFEQMAKLLRAKAEPFVVDVLQTRGNFDNGQTKVEIAETGTKYGYDTSSVWRDLDQEVKKYEELRKNVEKQLQIVAKTRTAVQVLNPLTGETELVEGCPVKSKTSYKLTRK